MSYQKEFVIIGWGLSGANLTWHLHQRGCKITVYDSGENYSSRVAAGLANPIAFKRLNMSWQANQLLPYAKKHYRHIEGLTTDQFFEAITIGRILASVEEQNKWSSLQGDDRFKEHLEDIEENKNKHIQAPFGIGKVKTTARLDVNRFLDTSKQYLAENGVEFINRAFSAKLVDEKRNYIYCSGFQLNKNIFFPHFRFIGTQGEIITIKAPDLKLNYVLNKNIFILPHHKDDLFTVGATYNRKIEEPKTTEGGQSELVEKLSTFASFDFEVVQHQAGIRPTVPDRRPLLGKHPKKSSLYVFNGMGSKAVMISPLYAKKMTEYLLDNIPLPKEVDVKRYDNKYEELINT